MKKLTRKIIKNRFGEDISAKDLKYYNHIGMTILETTKQKH